MAMYPYNHYSQFEVTVEIQYPLYNEKTGTTEQTTIPTGGILLFEMSLTLIRDRFPSEDASSTTIQESSSLFPSNDGIVSFFSFYQSFYYYVSFYFSFYSKPFQKRETCHF